MSIRYCSIALLVFLTTSLLAQNQGISYQAVARDAGGQLLANENIAVKFSILQNNPPPTGLLVYQETHNASTNDYGLFTLEIGSGNVLNGTWSAIDWPAGPHFLQVEIDEGSGYINMGTTELVSVPYAKHAHTADALTDPDWDRSGNDLANANSGQVDINNVSFPEIGDPEALQVDSIIAFANGGQRNFVYTNSDGQWVMQANNLSSSNPPKLVIDDDGDGVIVEEQLTINSTTSNPDPKTVYGNSMPLAYGYIQSGGQVTGGYGISSATLLGTGRYRVTLSNSPSGNTIPIVSCYDLNSLETAVVANNLGNSIDINTFNASGNPTATNFFIVVFGMPQ